MHDPRWTTRVCAVSSPEGSGCGMLFTLRSIPVVLMPFHVLGRVENASKTRVVTHLPSSSSSSSSSATSSASSQPAATASSEALVEFELTPKTMYVHSPCPPPGRAPDTVCMDYALISCRPAAVVTAAAGWVALAPDVAPPPELLQALRKLPTLEGAFNSAKEAAMAGAGAGTAVAAAVGAAEGEGYRGSAGAANPAAEGATAGGAAPAAAGAPAAAPEVILCAAPKQWLYLASEAKRTFHDPAHGYPFTSASSSSPSSCGYPFAPAAVDWRRGWVTAAPPLAPKWSGTVRYAARTDFGVSGAAVYMSIIPAMKQQPRQGVDSTSKQQPVFVLGAMHRAGLEGSDGEGITVYDIFRDVIETTEVGIIRAAANRGNLSPAVWKLLERTDSTDSTDSSGANCGSGSGSGSGSGGSVSGSGGVSGSVSVSGGGSGSGEAKNGGRCRAVTAAAQAVSARPVEAVKATAADPFVAVTAETAAVREREFGDEHGDVEHHAALYQLEGALCRWISHYPRSIRLAVAVCHALGALARAGFCTHHDDGASGAGAHEADECVLATVERHSDVPVVQSHGLWALRQRLKSHLGRERGRRREQERGRERGRGRGQGRGRGRPEEEGSPGRAGSSGMERGRRRMIERMASVAEAALAGKGGGGVGEQGASSSSSSSMLRDATLLVEMCRARV